MLRRSFFPLFFAVCLFSFAHSVSALTCPDGSASHTATQQEADSVPSGGITAGVTQICGSDAHLGISQATGAAKDDLNSMWCGGAAAQCKLKGITYTSSISGLDNNFSVCADSFMKALRAQDPSACIRSAYRSTDHQICACGGNANGIPGKCAAAGTSYHQKGLAIDVDHSISKERLWAIAAQAGLANPSGLHESDPDHLQPVGGTSKCSGSPVPQNDTTDLYAQTNLPFDNSLRQSLGLQPAPPPMQTQAATPVQATTATTPTTQATQTTGTASSQTGTSSAAPSTDSPNTTPYTAGTCIKQIYCSQNDGNLYNRSTTCVDTPYKQCPNGCIGLICNATSTANKTSNSDSSGQNQDVSGSSEGTSTFDIINYFANGGGATATDVGTATPIDITGLIQDANNASTLEPTQATSGQIIQTPSQGSAYGATSQQTFTSTNLANTPESNGFQKTSYAQTILSNMQAILVSILNYLQPFGGRVGASTNME
jgi:hypothetical protein